MQKIKPAIKVVDLDKGIDWREVVKLLIPLSIFAGLMFWLGTIVA